MVKRKLIVDEKESEEKEVLIEKIIDNLETFNHSRETLRQIWAKVKLGWQK